eukprot:scaffold4547_cov103-Cylindrotheca_fusiformis.AAC.8
MDRKIERAPSPFTFDGSSLLALWRAGPISDTWQDGFPLVSESLCQQSLAITLGEEYEPAALPPNHLQVDSPTSKRPASFHPALVLMLDEVVDIFKDSSNETSSPPLICCCSFSSIPRPNCSKTDFQKVESNKKFEAKFGDKSQMKQNMHDVHWTSRYQDLVQYQRKYGHCCVPARGTKAELELSRWVKRQRCQYKRRKAGFSSAMANERIRRLEAIGFVWDAHGRSWDQHLEELKEFKRYHGHSRVPQYQDYPELATWIKSQRRQYKLFINGQKSQMTSERIAALEAVDFARKHCH